MGKPRIYGMKTACVPNREADMRRRNSDFWKGLEFAENDLRRGRDKQERKLRKQKDANRWIPVAERLPDHNKSVLVYCENFTIQGGYTVHIGSCDSLNGGQFWFLRTQPGVSSFPNHEWKVTHWMPLPAPPKEGLHDL